MRQVRRPPDQYSAHQPQKITALYTHTRFIHNPHNYGLGMRLRTLRNNTWRRMRIWTSLGSIWLIALPCQTVSTDKAFSFPKRQFGCKGDQRSFHAERCDTAGCITRCQCRCSFLLPRWLCAARLLYMFANCNHTAA